MNFALGFLRVHSLSVRIVIWRLFSLSFSFGSYYYCWYVPSLLLLLANCRRWMVSHLCVSGWWWRRSKPCETHRSLWPSHSRSINAPGQVDRSIVDRSRSVCSVLRRAINIYSSGSSFFVAPATHNYAGDCCKQHHRYLLALIRRRMSLRLMLPQRE